MFLILKKFMLRGFSPYYYLKKYSCLIFKKKYKIVQKKYVEKEVRKLEKLGYTILKSNKSILDAALKKCIQLSNSYKIKKITEGKTFWNFISENDDLMKYQEIKSYVTSKYFIDLASSYLNSKATLTNVNLIISYPNNAPYNHSQLWHLDADDTKICTFYLHCSDVDKDSGPFKLAPKNLSKRKMIPKWLRKYGYKNDYIYNVICNQDNVKELTGKSGFEFVCDTANTYHCGSKCKDKTRLVLSFRYVAETPLYDLSDWAKKFNKSAKLTV